MSISMPALASSAPHVRGTLFNPSEGPIHRERIGFLTALGEPRVPKAGHRDSVGWDWPARRLPPIASRASDAGDSRMRVIAAAGSGSFPLTGSGPLTNSNKAKTCKILAQRASAGVRRFRGCVARQRM